MRKFLVLLIVLFLNISTVFAAKIPDDGTKKNQGKPNQ